MTSYILLPCAFGALSVYHAIRLRRCVDENSKEKVRQCLHHELTSAGIYAAALIVHLGLP